LSEQDAVEDVNNGGVKASWRMLGAVGQVKALPIHTRVLTLNANTAWRCEWWDGVRGWSGWLLWKNQEHDETVN